MPAQSHHAPSDYIEMTDQRYKRVTAGMGALIVLAAIVFVITALNTKASSFEQQLSVTAVILLMAMLAGMVCGLGVVFMRAFVIRRVRLLTVLAYLVFLAAAITMVYAVGTAHRLIELRGHVIMGTAFVAAFAGVTVVAFIDRVSMIAFQMSTYRDVFYYGRLSADNRRRSEEMRDEQSSLRARLDTVRLQEDEIDKMKVEQVELRSEVEAAEAALNEIRNTNAALQERRSMLARDYSHQQDVNATLIAEISATEDEITRLKARNDGLTVHRLDLKAQERSLAEQIDRRESGLADIGLADEDEPAS